MKKILQVLLLFILCFLCSNVHAQKKKIILKNTTKKHKHAKKPVIKYGVASYYAENFRGKKTSSGETYQQETYTAACNVLPLNTWIKVTNLHNDNTVIVKINDRLHPKNKRLVDLSKSAAIILDFISEGITKVKIEVLKDFNPAETTL